MRQKQLLILANLLKVDNELASVIRALLASSFPNKYIQRIIKARPYWVAMQLGCTTEADVIAKGLPSPGHAIKIKFIIKKNDRIKLERIINPLGKAWIDRQKTIEWSTWFNPDFSIDFEQHIQCDYWWHY